MAGDPVHPDLLREVVEVRRRTTGRCPWPCSIVPWPRRFQQWNTRLPTRQAPAAAHAGLGIEPGLEEGESATIGLTVEPGG